MSAADTPEMLLARAAGLTQLGRVADAIEAYRRVLAHRPNSPNIWYNLAALQRQARDYRGALASYQEALDRDVTDPEEVRLNRAVILSDHLGCSDAAQAELEAAIAVNPRYVPALLNLGNLHEDRGDRASAREVYERALELAPDNALALARVAGVAALACADDPLIARIRAALRRPDTSAMDRADLGFALGRLLDSAGAYAEAFAAYSAANEASRATLGARYDRRAQERFIDRLIGVFAEPANPSLGTDRPEAPVFICGMFRSGSTLTEQILASHSRVTPGGELDLLPALIRHLQPYPDAVAAASPETLDRLRSRYLSELRQVHPRADVVTDKRPDNFLHIGLIKTLFPRAKIVHTRRHPLDNCLSVYFLHLDPSMAYAHDLDDIAHWYRQYSRLMGHWKKLYPSDIHDVDYDELVAYPTAVIDGLLRFCGLPWEDACLSFHNATNVVKTASAWQVREPFYRNSSGRWRNYEPFLLSLRAAVGDAYREG